MASRLFPRAGAWVVLDNRVGILFSMGETVSTVDPTDKTKQRTIDTYDPTVGEVHFVDENGDTEETAKGVPLAALSQASYEQIPAKRRPERDHAERLGYK